MDAHTADFTTLCLTHTCSPGEPGLPAGPSGPGSPCAQREEAPLLKLLQHARSHASLLEITYVSSPCAWQPHCTSVTRLSLVVFQERQQHSLNARSFRQTMSCVSGQRGNLPFSLAGLEHLVGHLVPQCPSSEQQRRIGQLQSLQKYCS